MDITGLIPQDRPKWAELWRTYLLFYDTTLPDEVYDHAWRRMQDGMVLQGLAARVDGQIVGITHFLFHESAWTTTPVCYLQDLFVQSAARGQGIGRALIEAVAAHARKRDSARLYWLTQDHNTAARLLYDRIAKHSGFIRYEYPLS